MVASGGSQLDSKAESRVVVEPSRREALLKHCCDLTIRSMLEMIPPAIDALAEDLFREAEMASSTQLQNDVLNRRDALQRHQQEFSAQLQAQILARFEAMSDGSPPSAHEDSAGSHSPSELKLIDDADLEEKLTLLGMVSKLELRYSPEIYALNERFSVLNRGGRRINDETNPCGPMMLGEAIDASVAGMDSDSFPGTLLFKELDVRIQSDLGACYQAINTYLIEQDILPNLQPAAPSFRPKRSGRAIDEPVEDELPPEAPQETAPAPRSHGRRATDRPAQTQYDQGRPVPLPVEENRSLIAGIRELLGSRSRPASSAAAPVPGNRLQSVLSDLQSRAATSTTDPDARTSIADLKASLGKALSSKDGQGQTHSLSQAHNQTFDIFEMLYDFVEQESTMHRKVQGLLNQLQIPLLRVALEDDAFFENPEHPARKLFNTVAEAGELWLGDSAEDNKTFGKMQTATEHVLKEYSNDTGVFQDLISDLDQHIKLLNRRSQISEKRHIETIQGQERLELARRQAQQVIEQLIEKYQPPLFIRSILEKPWADYLGLILLRHGDKSDAWNSAIGVANMLIISVQENLHASVRDRINNRKDWFYDQLKRGLSQVGYYENDINDVMANLQACHKWSLADPVSKSAEPRTDATPGTAGKTDLAGSPSEAADDVARDVIQVHEATRKVEQDKAQATAESPSQPLIKPVPSDTRIPQSADEKVALLESTEKLPNVLKTAVRKSDPILKSSLPKLNTGQTRMLGKLRKMPFGTWFEMIFGDSVDWVRRKLAWYSPVTDRCMLVNNRGVSCEELTMHDLAIMMDGQKARLFTPRKRPLMDRALSSIFRQLKKLGTLTRD